MRYVTTWARVYLKSRRRDQAEVAIRKGFHTVLSINGGCRTLYPVANETINEEEFWDEQI